ncbi:MAG: hypothetical protein R3E93_04650 [Thiothrix sp.]
MAFYQAGLKLVRKRKAAARRCTGRRWVAVRPRPIGRRLSSAFKDITLYFKEFAQQPGLPRNWPISRMRLTARLRLWRVMSLSTSRHPDFPAGTIVRHWIGQTLPAEWLDGAVSYYQKLNGIGFLWLAGEHAAVLAQACLTRTSVNPCTRGTETPTARQAHNR